MGAQPYNQPAEVGGLSLIVGDQKLWVAILKNDAVIQRNRILETILALNSKREAFNLLYLAAPKLIGTAIDAALFRSYGIGLLLFDERRIEEAVPPETFQAPASQEPASRSPDPGIARELAALKSMYAEMERSIARLREEFKSFQESPRAVGPKNEPVNGQRLVPPTPMFTGQGAPLPSFFSNNPWLEVLSKRGRTEEEPLAA
jgi:hypothetical protein